MYNSYSTHSITVSITVSITATAIPSYYFPLFSKIHTSLIYVWYMFINYLECCNRPGPGKKHMANEGPHFRYSEMGTVLSIVPEYSRWWRLGVKFPENGVFEQSPRSQTVSAVWPVVLPPVLHNVHVHLSFWISPTTWMTRAAVVANTSHMWPLGCLLCTRK